MDSNFSHDEFVLVIVNDVLKKYNNIKETIKNPKST